MSLNRALIIGHLGKDPEVRFTPGGQACARFSVATSEVYTDKDNQRQERTTWHNIVVWGKQAESCGQYLTKGRQVFVEGRIETRQYDDKDGNRRYITEIIAQRVQFLGGKGESTGRRDDAPQPSHDSDIPFAWLLALGVGTGWAMLHAASVGAFLA